MKGELASNPLLTLPPARAERLAAEYLRAAGWRCLESPSLPEEAAATVSLTELAERFGLSQSAMHKRMNHPHRPPCLMDRSPGGRLLGIVLNAELEAWLSRPAQPGVRS